MLGYSKRMYCMSQHDYMGCESCCWLCILAVCAAIAPGCMLALERTGYALVHKERNTYRLVTVVKT